MSGKGSGRVSIAGLICVKPGERTRLIYRTITHHGRKNEKKGFRETDYAALLDAAHQQLDSPIVLVWDNLTAHHDAVMQKLIDARSWLTVSRFPTYAPELNPVEGVWANLKNGLGNLAARNIDQLTALVKTRLKKTQHRTGLIDAFIAETGLTPAIDPP